MTIKIVQDIAYEDGKLDPPVKLLCLTADVVSLPLTYPIGSKAFTTDGRVLYIFDGSAWSPV